MDANFKTAKLVVADLDGTLSKSKAPMDDEMSELIRELLKYKPLAVISGGSYKQFQDQFITNLSKNSSDLSNLYIFPTCATSMYVMNGGRWDKVYGESLSENIKKEIFAAFEKGLDEYGFKKPDELYGEMIEDRGTQITFSAFGQQAPLELKKTWDPEGKKRLSIIEHLVKYLPKETQAKVGGTTSIDITLKGIDKAYGIKKIQEHLGYTIEEMLFLGDALFEGGNDYPVKATGVRSIQVSGPEESKKIIKQIIQSAKN